MYRWVVLAAAGCTVDEEGNLVPGLGDPQDWIDPVEYHLAAATTASWLGMITLAHLTEGGHPCAALEADLSLTITPGPQCPHWLLEDLSGTARVEVGSSDGSVSTASAEGLEVAGRPLLAQTFSMLQVLPGDDVQILLSTSDYEDDGTLWGWLAQVDRAGTPELADDILALAGGTSSPQTLPEDYRRSDNVVTMLSDFILTPACRRNPISGSMLIEGSSYWPLLEVNGHEACDGTVDVDSNKQADEWTPSLDLLAGQP
jgi:hypothetical protein